MARQCERVMLTLEPTGECVLRRLRDIRLSKGLTQKQVAAKIGVVRSGVSMWEKGGRTPTLEGILDYAEALGCEVRIEIQPRKEGA